MEPRNATMLESSGEDAILIETVKSIVTQRDRNESETEDDFFLVSQDQGEQYSGENVEVTTSHKHETKEVLTWIHLCRTCANTCDNLIPIFEGEGAEHDLSNKILKYLPIHISNNDTLPLQLCHKCAGMLLAWHELSEGCLSAEKKLLKLQETLENKQQDYPASLANFEVSTLVTTTTPTIVSNTTNSQPDQQIDAKNGAHDIEEINKSNRNWQRPSLLEANMRSINGFFSNLSFVHEVTNHTFCVRAIVRGSREPDRYVILSVNEGSIIIALELAQVLDRIYSAHDWRPRRSLIFCMSLMASDLCARTLPTFIQRKVVAYIAVPGRFIEANDRVTLAGSDVMRSIAVDAINAIPDVIDNWIYLEQVFDRRLSLNIPQVIFLFNSNSANSQTHHNQSLQSRGIILAQMISQTMWRLSESIIIRWEPKYFNKTVSEVLESIDSEVLESIDSSKFQDAKEKLKSTLRILLAAVNDLNAKIDATENTQILRVRMWNDLLLDLDKTLLCFDENFNENLQHSQLIIFRIFKSTSNILNYLNEMAKCYENAIQVLQER